MKENHIREEQKLDAELGRLMGLQNFYPTMDGDDLMLLLKEITIQGSLPFCHNVTLFQTLEGKFAAGCDCAVKGAECNTHYADSLPMAICLLAREILTPNK